MLGAHLWQFGTAARLWRTVSDTGGVASANRMEMPQGLSVGTCS